MEGATNMWDFYLTDEDYEIAESNGIPRKIAYGRWYRGWDRERILTEPYVKRSRTYKNKRKSRVTPEQYEIAKQNGVGRNTVINRVYQLKWTVSQAITLPLGTIRKYEVNQLERVGM